MFTLRLLSEGGAGPNTELVRLLYIGISFFFLVILAGWWSASKKPDKPEAQPMEIEHGKSEPKSARKK